MPTASYAPTSTVAPPALGYGQRGEAPIDAVNQWMRGQPWYQALLKSFGQDPTNVHLSESQKQQVIKAAQSNGVIVDEGHNGQEVDDSGNFQAKSHALRNTLIVAGIAAAALATAGAAGAFSGAALPAASGVSGLSATSLGLPVTAGLGTAGASAAGAVGAGAAGAAGAAGSGAASYGPAAAGAGLSTSDLLKYGVPVAGNVIGGIIQAKASGDATAQQQKYLEDALAYTKEQDAYKRNTEASRYATYSGNIAPYLANGSSANDRMAAVLGLPARSTATFPSASATPSTTTAPPRPFSTQPVPMTNTAPEPMITIQAPTGQTKQVPASQQQHWESVGAKVVQGAA